MDADRHGKGARRPLEGWAAPVWERQPHEGDRAFAAYATYRDLGPARSTRIVAEELAKSDQLIRRWSSEWGWVERAGAWDDEAYRNHRERDLVERHEARRKMLETHAKAGATLHEIGVKALARYDTSSPGTADEARARIAALTASDAARLMETGAKLERQARGETPERVDMREAMIWVESFLDLALRYVPLERQDAFLADVDVRLGVAGTGG
jgi:hypothetical protein